MGQAKLRGTFEQRQAEGVIRRKEQEAERVKELERRRELMKFNRQKAHAKSSGSEYIGLMAAMALMAIPVDYAGEN